MSNPRGGHEPHYDADTLAQMRHLWEGAPELSAAAIGGRFGVSKNVIIGQAHRRGWNRPADAPRSTVPPRETSTTLTRLDAINARMDAVLAETRAQVEGRPKLMVAVDVGRAAA